MDRGAAANEWIDRLGRGGGCPKGWFKKEGELAGPWRACFDLQKQQQWWWPCVGHTEWNEYERNNGDLTILNMVSIITKSRTNGQ